MYCGFPFVAVIVMFKFHSDHGFSMNAIIKFSISQTIQPEKCHLHEKSIMYMVAFSPLFFLFFIVTPLWAGI